MSIAFNKIRAYGSFETGFQFDFQLEILRISGNAAVGPFVIVWSPGTRIRATRSQI